MTVLIDTNIFLASVFPKDVNHQKAKAALRELRGFRVVPAPVLPEPFYMVKERMTYRDALKVLRMIRGGAFQIEQLTLPDMVRMEEIMEQYQDNEFDFVDVSLMVIAERLNISEIYTFDRRDFTAFRPTHCDFFELLP